jgi:hypothetical protein
LTRKDFDIPDAAKEALALVIQAHGTLRGRPSNAPATTGARRAAVLGKVVADRSDPARARAWRAARPPVALFVLSNYSLDNQNRGV